MRKSLTTAVLFLTSVAAWGGKPDVAPSLPDAPSAVLLGSGSASLAAVSSSVHYLDSLDSALQDTSAPTKNQPSGQQPTTPAPDPCKVDTHGEPVQKQKYASIVGPQCDANGNPIPLNKRQPTRILGFMPNYRSVSAGAAAPQPGWKYNFKVATRQSFDYSSFIFLGLTSGTAYLQDSHPSLDGGSAPFWAYLWRGFLDKTDGTYIGAWLLPSVLREDTRYFPLGAGHPIVVRALYVMSRQVVARDYTHHNVFNMAGLGGKVLTQYISRSYYPPGSSDLSVLATKFAYASMRDIGFSAIREFYPDIAAHYVRKHKERVARQNAKDAEAQAARDSVAAGAKP